MHGSNITPLNMQTRDAIVRQEQARFGQRTIAARPDSKKFVAKGHDIQLQQAQHEAIPVIISLVNAEEPLKGAIARRDKYTITLRHEIADLGLRDSIIYKHAIESVTLNREVQ